MANVAKENINDEIRKAYEEFLDSFEILRHDHEKLINVFRKKIRQAQLDLVRSKIVEKK